VKLLNQIETFWPQPGIVFAAGKKSADVAALGIVIVILHVRSVVPEVQRYWKPSRPKVCLSEAMLVDRGGRTLG
jgi:hypothetical protein